MEHSPLLRGTSWECEPKALKTATTKKKFFPFPPCTKMNGIRPIIPVYLLKSSVMLSLIASPGPEVSGALRTQAAPGHKVSGVIALRVTYKQFR